MNKVLLEKGLISGGGSTPDHTSTPDQHEKSVIEWIDLPNGNAVWRHGEWSCTVYKKKDTKSSYRWIVSHQKKGGVQTKHHATYTWPSRNKAKSDVQNILDGLAKGLEWNDAIN